MSDIIDQYLNEIQDINEVGIITGIMSITGLISLGLSIYNQFLAKNKNRCENMEGIDKQICYVQLRIEATKKLITQLRSSQSDCKDTRDPKKCTDRLNDETRKYNLKLTKLSKKLYRLRNKQRNI